MTSDAPKIKTSTWTVRLDPVITKKMVEQTTRKATIWQKVRLLIRPSQYSFDGKSIIRYKEMDGICYVMKRGTRL